MTATIWKFPLAITDLQRVRMPRGARLLSVQAQHVEEWGVAQAASYDALMLWAHVDSDEPIVERFIAVVGTGHPAPDIGDDTALYVGTVQTGPLVWHIFDGGEVHDGIG